MRHKSQGADYMNWAIPRLTGLKYVTKIVSGSWIDVSTSYVATPMYTRLFLYFKFI